MPHLVPPAPAPRVTVIRPQRGLSALDPVELWRRRELVWVLALRDLRVRYKQTFLGVAWAVIQPLATMVVLHIFFGKVMGMAERMDGVAYPIFLFAGNLPWVLFASTLNLTSNSLVNNSHILSKVYFPRLMLPLSAAIAPLVDYLIAFGVLIGLMLWYDAAITWRMLMLVPLLALLMAAAVGMGVLLSAMMVRYRDVRHIVPFMTQLLFFATPVIYPVAFVPPAYRWAVYMNPLAGTIEAMRAVVLGGPVAWDGLAISGGVSLAVLVIGAVWFGAAERKFADVI